LNFPHRQNTRKVPQNMAIALAVGVSGSIGLFFGIVPAKQAAKLDPIVALRSA
jgi:putative ABC transport system permease protein